MREDDWMMFDAFVGYAAMSGRAIAAGPVGALLKEHLLTVGAGDTGADYEEAWPTRRTMRSLTPLRPCTRRRRR